MDRDVQLLYLLSLVLLFFISIKFMLLVILMLGISLATLIPIFFPSTTAGFHLNFCLLNFNSQVKILIYLVLSDKDIQLSWESQGRKSRDFQVWIFWNICSYTIYLYSYSIYFVSYFRAHAICIYTNHINENHKP